MIAAVYKIYNILRFFHQLIKRGGKALISIGDLPCRQDFQRLSELLRVQRLLQRRTRNSWCNPTQ